MTATSPAAPARRRVLTALLCTALILSAQAIPAAAQEAPADGQIVYGLTAPDSADGGGFGAAHLDGENQRQLTTEPENTVDRLARWSPDGRWIAFTRRTGEVTQPMAVFAAGGEPVALAEQGAGATWTPDGSALVWTVAEPEPAIIVAEVTATDPNLVVGEQRRIEVPRRANSAVVSPGSDRILFRMRRADADGADLWTVAMDGSDLRRLTDDVDVSIAPAHAHSWSPDGTQVALLGADAVSRGRRRAHIVNADGTGRRLLFPSSECEFTKAAVWAPHGEFLAVLPNCEEAGFQLVTPTGDWLGTVGAGPVRFGGIAFAPDAADLYVVAAYDDGAGGEARQLQRIPMDGSAAVTVMAREDLAMSPVDIYAPPGVVPRVVKPPASTDPDPEPARTRRPRLEHACPVDEVPYADFLDVNLDNPHRQAIDCMAWWEVVSGVAEYRYGPGRSVTREQMTTLLARVITTGGATLPSTTTDYFDDDETSLHESNINSLAEAGVVRGAADRQFRPGAAVRRDQMASLVVAAYRYIGSAQLDQPTDDYFSDDDGTVHEGAINQAAEAGFVTGVSEGSYAPDRTERRDQAATRAARVLDALVENGDVTRPREGLARVTRVVDGDTVLANDPELGTIRIRFVGMNAPETGTCGATAATNALGDLVLGKTVRLSSGDPSSIGRRRRPLRFVEVLHDGKWIDVNAEQLRRGHAVWFPNEDGKEPRNNNAYQGLVREAMAAERNLWNPTKCGRGPQQTAQLDIWVNADPPGPDRNNVNGEWVKIHNTGTEDVDLYGWLLRDASTKTPYQFVSDSVVPAGATMTVHVGEGTDESLVRYWGRSNPLFANARRVEGQAVGDGAYLVDNDGDIRAHFMYPCVGECLDPLIGQVKISNVVYDPYADDTIHTSDEFVKLRNISETTVSLYGYRLVAAPHTYHFGPDSIIAPGETLKVQVGVGEDSAARKYWGHEEPILDDSAGLAKLRTYDGIEISCFAWGTAAC